MTEPRDWYLREWVAHTEKRQADLARGLGWHKNQAYRLWHGEQPYRRDEVNAVAGWLGIEPYELLMPPAEAMRLRRLRQILEETAAGAAAGPAPTAASSRTGTNG